MKIVSLNMIVELNKLLSSENAKIHLRDACGCQSLWIESTSKDTISNKAYDIINDFFKKERMTPVFNDNRIDFHIE